MSTELGLFGGVTKRSPWNELWSGALVFAVFWLFCSSGPKARLADYKLSALVPRMPRPLSPFLTARWHLHLNLDKNRQRDVLVVCQGPVSHSIQSPPFCLHIFLCQAVSMSLLEHDESDSLDHVALRIRAALLLQHIDDSAKVLAPFCRCCKAERPSLCADICLATRQTTPHPAYHSLLDAIRTLTAFAKIFGTSSPMQRGPCKSSLLNRAVQPASSNDRRPALTEAVVNRVSRRRQSDRPTQCDLLLHRRKSGWRSSFLVLERAKKGSCCRHCIFARFGRSDPSRIADVDRQTVPISRSTPLNVSPPISHSDFNRTGCSVRD